MIRRVPSEVSRDAARFFNSAALGYPPRRSIDGVERISQEEWDALVEQARDAIGSVLAPLDRSAYTYDPDTAINLFTNTTTAFGRVLSRIERNYAGSRPTLLTTDLEFPGCIAAVDDSWTGPVVMAQVASLVSADPTTADTVLHDALIRTYNFVKPRVVFLSHVLRSNGQVISTQTLRYFREANPRILIILDGSQAVGNVVVTPEMLDAVDFYIASGHKWLGGSTTSGFAWIREPGRWSIADPAQSLAYRGKSGGSGNAPAWRSLAESISDLTRDRPKSRLGQIASHNRALGALFAKSLSPLAGRLSVCTPLTKGVPPGGLVTVAATKGDGNRLANGLARQGFQFTVLEPEQVRWRSTEKDRFLVACDPVFPAIKRATEYTPTLPKRPRRELRFCFHYWHEEEDVLKLADSIIKHFGRSGRGGQHVSSKAAA